MQSHSFDDVQCIARGIYLEGLSVDDQNERIWFSDVIGGGIHSVGPTGDLRSFNKERLWTGGILLNEDGCILSSGPGGIAWTDPETGASGMLIDRIDGTPVDGVNEMVPDGSGGMIFGTVDIPAIARGEAPRAAALCRLGLDGQITILKDGLTFSNGLMLSLDGKQLFHNETFVGTFAYPVKADGSLGEGVKILGKPDCDGMAIDADGNLWITGFRSSHVICVAPSGKLLGEVETPAGAITQLRFGGPDCRDVYFTAVPADAGDGLAEGELPSEKVSDLYRARSDLAGAPIQRTRFQIRR